ncbi:hypothetical protein AB996_2041 [Lactococcus cremoris]|uniref:GmrSD restriction endonucleases N-terminal domain-containing protein n=1 Tax=Lactococcus lactis subsp. cremoris TaxID=1359 RepID=A0A166IZT4_LACLC|nr:DUF262 domain-containing protein [Lactococcus cremoris]KZK05280.1 hypothetical protein AB996_2041 [Lactococcus cremoris]
MNVNLEIENYSLKELFSENDFLEKSIFVIPRYQRVYSWKVGKNEIENKQVNDFWNDIVGRYEKQETDYFGGILLNKKLEGDIIKYEVVDGQQRLITSILLYAALGREWGDRLPIVLDVDDENQTIRKICNNCEIDNGEKRTNIGRAYSFFKNSIGEVNTEKLKLYFENVKLSVAIIDNEFESNLLFGRLNTRGLPLSDVELIKYHIFSKFDNHSGPGYDDIPLQIWKQIQDTLSHSIDRSLNIEEFIYIYWRIENPVIEFSFDNFKSRYSEEHYLSEFLSKILELVLKVEKYKVNDSGSDNGIGDNLCWLFKFKIGYRNKNTLLAIIKVLSTDLNDSDKRKIIDLITLTEAIRFILEIKGVERDFDKLDNFYNKTILEIGENAIYDELIKVIRNNYQNKKLVVENIAQLRYVKDSIKIPNKSDEKLMSGFVLYRLSDLPNVQNISVEHILDKALGENKQSPNFNLGNLVLLESRYNTGLPALETNKLTGEKLDIYNQSGLIPMREFLNRKKRQTRGWKVAEDDRWDPLNFNFRDIESRAKYLAEGFYSLFKNHIIEYDDGQR